MTTSDLYLPTMKVVSEEGYQYVPVNLERVRGEIRRSIESRVEYKTPYDWRHIVVCCAFVLAAVLPIGAVTLYLGGAGDQMVDSTLPSARVTAVSYIAPCSAQVHYDNGMTEIVDAECDGN